MSINAVFEKTNEFEEAEPIRYMLCSRSHQIDRFSPVQEVIQEIVSEIISRIEDLRLSGSGNIYYS